MNERTDSDLLRDYTEKASEPAFNELVSRHIGLVYSVALRVVVDAHLAEDVTQTTFAILAGDAHRLTGRLFLSSWLHRTSANQAAKLVRGEMRRRAREQDFMSPQLSAPEPEWEQVAPKLDAALNTLAENDRTVLLLRFFERKTAADIAAALDLSEEAAQKRVSRALDRLRGLLAGQGAALSAATLTMWLTTKSVVAAPIGLSTSVSVAALTGATIGAGANLGLLNLFSMSKLQFAVFGTTLLVAAVGPLAVHHHYIAQLRSQNQALKTQVAGTDALRFENQELAAQLAADKRELAQAQAQMAELLRLRGEVGPLRRDSQELARLRAQPPPPPPAALPAPPPDELAQRFEAERARTINALKIIGLQLRVLKKDNALLSALAADGSLAPNFAVEKLGNFDMKKVELLVNDPAQLNQLLDNSPETIIARTAEPIPTPDGRYLRVYALADGSVQSRSTEHPNEAFDTNWHLVEVKRQPGVQ